jgi:hypothetical protein
MHMDAFLWMFLPVFVAGGSALLSFYIMQAKMEVALARERESLAEARAAINTHKVTLDERVRATEEATKRQAMDDFMHEFRVEERSYVRESKSLTASKKSMVMQERLFFRNIPLSNWIEHEMVVEEGTDLDQLPRESVFAAPSNVSSIEEGRLPISKMLDEFPMPMPKRESGSLMQTIPAMPTIPTIPARAVAFGAQ